MDNEKILLLLHRLANELELTVDDVKFILKSGLKELYFGDMPKQFSELLDNL